MVGVPDVRDLGPVEGREVPTVAPPGAPPMPSHVPHPPAGAAPSTAHLPAVPAPRGRVGAARAEAVEAWHAIREAHRRGPKPNARPLPRWVTRLAWLLDDAVEIPGTGGRRIGIDGFITLVPGIGDAVGLGLSMIVVSAGVVAGVSIPTVLRMLVNVAFEGVVGLIPFGGALFDMAYKANDRNVRLIEADLADRRRTRRSSLAILVVLVLTSIVGFVMMVLASLLGLAVFVWLIWRLLG